MALHLIQQIKTTPMAPAGCHTHRHASRETYYNNMIISYIIHATSQLWPYHITCQTLQKQVRRPLIVVASFTWLIWVSSKNAFLPT